MEIFVHCTLKSHNLQIHSLFPAIYDIDYADLFQTEFIIEDINNFQYSRTTHIKKMEKWLLISLF